MKVMTKIQEKFLNNKIKIHINLLVDLETYKLINLKIN